MSFRCLALIALLAISLGGGSVAQVPPRTGPPASERRSEVIVAVAASMVPVMEALRPVIERETSATLVLSSGSSSVLRMQADRGAPFDVFVSSDEGQPAKLAAAGRTLGDTPTVYARGTLVIVAAPGEELPITLEDVPARAKQGRVAIANPETAPYGRAAREALSGVMSVSGRDAWLIHAEDASQALQMADTGNVWIAFTAKSLAMKKKLRFTEVDPRRHAPINQAVVLVDGGSNRAGGRIVRDVLLGPDGRRALLESGYTLPEQEQGVGGP